jgi:hypothetical protein
LGNWWSIKTLLSQIKLQYPSKSPFKGGLNNVPPFEGGLGGCYLA